MVEITDVQRTQSIDRFAQEQGFALRTYFINCIRRGNREELEEQLAELKINELMQDVFKDDVSGLFLGLMLTWGQFSRAAVEGGLPEEESSSCYLAHVARARKAESVRELSELNCSLLVEYARLVDELRGQGASSVLVAQCKEWVHSHVYDPIDGASLASQLHYSRAWLSRTFKNMTGESLHSYVQREKVEEAKRLLRYTNLPISAIASSLCFSSPSHFGQVFRSVCAMTPSQYRGSTTQI